MTALIAVVAAAAVLTFTLSARPVVAALGGLAATFAWLVAFSAAVREHWLMAAGCLVMAGWCAAYAFQSGRQVSADQRAADEQAEEVVR